MKNAYVSLILIALELAWTGWAQAQTQIQGKVIGENGEILAGVNVFLKNTFDGSSTDTTGFFQFSTTEKSEDTLVVSLIGYQEIEQKINLEQSSVELSIALKEEANALNTVVITAGFFEASDEKKMVILKPLDVVRTASSSADIYGAMQTLPGSQKVGESGGLFVRGGSSAETHTLMDGMLIQNPLYSQTPDVAQRGRFSPFLFKGTAFSTGGYSAQYGQALSSVLALTTKDLPTSDELEGFISPLGGSATATKRWENTSLGIGGSYFNLGWVFDVVPQNIDWQKAPETQGATVIFRHKPSKSGIIKAFGNYEFSKLGINFGEQSDVGSFAINNHNIYTNLTYQDFFGDWTIQSGFSYSYNKDKIDLNQDKVGNFDNRYQGRLVLTKDIFENSSILFGTELHHYTYQTAFNEQSIDFEELFTALFAETEIYITRKLAGRIGARLEHSKLLRKVNIAPRVSLAYKTGDYSQVSFAFGQFYQSPNYRYLFTNHDLDFEKASHYILNYQWIKDKRTFRVESYYKNYHNLVRELGIDTFDPNPNRFRDAPTNNSGNGYAGGLDIFWRDQKSLGPNVEYRVSYSYLDTKRFFQNYLDKAVPTFASKHNVSVVYNHFIVDWRLDINTSYSYASGRTYFRPDAESFLSDQLPDYHNLSLGINYLIPIKSNTGVIVMRIDNVLGFRNVYGRRFTGNNGESYEVLPSSRRSYLIGFALRMNRNQ